MGEVLGRREESVSLLSRPNRLWGQHRLLSIDTRLAHEAVRPPTLSTALYCERSVTCTHSVRLHVVVQVYLYQILYETPIDIGIFVRRKVQARACNKFHFRLDSTIQGDWNTEAAASLIWETRQFSSGF
jgi:hypothetical protein